LPAPDAPNTTVAPRARASNMAASLKPPSCFAMSIRSKRAYPCPIWARWAIRSDTNNAVRARMNDTIDSRAAVSSPPGTCSAP